MGFDKVDLPDDCFAWIGHEDNRAVRRFPYKTLRGGCSVYESSYIRRILIVLAAAEKQTNGMWLSKHTGWDGADIWMGEEEYWIVKRKICGAAKLLGILSNVCNDMKIEGFR